MTIRIGADYSNRFLQSALPASRPFLPVFASKAASRTFLSQRTFNILTNLPLIGNLFRLTLPPPKRTKPRISDMTQAIIKNPEESIKKYCEEGKMLSFALTRLGYTKHLALHVQHFTLNDKERKEVALLMAKEDPTNLCLHIRNFAITAPLLRERLAFLCAQSAPADLCLSLNEFTLPQEALLEVSLLLAQESPGWLIKALPDILLEEESLKKVIQALLENPNNGSFVAYILSSLTITDQLFLKKVFLTLIELNKPSIYHTIQGINTLIKDESIKTDLCLLFAKSDPKSFCAQIHRLGIKQEKTRKDLAYIVAKSDPRTLAEYIQGFAIEDQVFLRNLVLILRKSVPLSAFISTAHNFKLKEDPQFFSSWSFQILRDSQSKFREFAKAFNLSCDFIASLIFDYIKQFGAPFSPEEQALICKKLTSYRNKDLKLALFVQLAEHCKDQAFRDVYKTFCPKTTDTPFLTLAILPAIYPSAWIVKAQACGIDTSEAQKKVATFLRKQELRPLFRDQVKSPLTENFLLACEALEKDSSLESHEKLATLAKVCTGAADIDNLASLVPLCAENLGKRFLQKELLNESASAAIDVLVSEKLVQTSYADLKDIPNLTKAYKETFGSGSIPQSLQIFEASLRRWNIPAIREDHTRLARSVLLKRVGVERYLIDDNPTLKVVAAKAPSLLAKWQSPAISISCNDLALVDTDDPITLFEAPSSPRTCLRLNGGSNNNCLPSLVLDGTIRMLIAKDKSSKLVARRIVRLLLDQDREPILVLETLYSIKQLTKDESEAFERLAAQKATDLGVRLLAKNPTSLFFSTPHQTKKILFLGGNCTFTYSDILGGNIPRSNHLVEINTSSFKEF